MDGIEELVKNVTINLLKYQAVDLKSFAKSAKVEDRTEILRNMVSLGFHRITFTEACQMLSDAGQFDKVVDDLSREHELYLCKKLGERSKIRIDNLVLVRRNPTNQRCAFSVFFPLFSF